MAGGMPRGKVTPDRAMRGATPPHPEIGHRAGPVRGDIIAAFMRGLRYFSS